MFEKITQLTNEKLAIITERIYDVMTSRKKTYYKKVYLKQEDCNTFILAFNKYFNEDTQKYMYNLYASCYSNMIDENYNIYTRQISDMYNIKDNVNMYNILKDLSDFLNDMYKEFQICNRIDILTPEDMESMIGKCMNVIKDVYPDYYHDIITKDENYRLRMRVVIKKLIREIDNEIDKTRREILEKSNNNKENNDNFGDPGRTKLVLRKKDDICEQKDAKDENVNVIYLDLDKYYKEIHNFVKKEKAVGESILIHLHDSFVVEVQHFEHDYSLKLMYHNQNWSKSYCMQSHTVPFAELKNYMCCLVSTRFPGFNEWYNKEHGTNVTFEFRRKKAIDKNTTNNEENKEEKSLVRKIIIKPGFGYKQIEDFTNEIKSSLGEGIILNIDNEFAVSIISYNNNYTLEFFYHDPAWTTIYIIKTFTIGISNLHHCLDDDSFWNIDLTNFNEWYNKHYKADIKFKIYIKHS